MTAKVTTAAKGAKPAALKAAPKKAAAKSAKTATSKTTKTAKSAKTASAKHTAPDAHQKHMAHEKVVAARAGFAVGDLLPVCSSQALAQSLRLAGQRVSDDEVLELHYRAGGPAAGMVSVGEALAAAALFGLAGCRPVSAERKNPGREWPGFSCGPAGEQGRGPGLRSRFPGCVLGCDHLAVPHIPLILRIDVPGPHAVLATADGWWSWGELFSPWPARVSEAWAVSWLEPEPWFEQAAPGRVSRPGSRWAAPTAPILGAAS